MNTNLRKLCEIVGVNPEMLQYNRMTTDEILDCIHCGLDEDGEIIDLDTGRDTGFCYDDVEY